MTKKSNVVGRLGVKNYRIAAKIRVDDNRRFAKGVLEMDKGLNIFTISNPTKDDVFLCIVGKSMIEIKNG